MNNRALTKVLGGIVLTILWIVAILYTSPTQALTLGLGATISAKLVVIILGLLILLFYHLLYRSSSEATKLSWTSVLTLVWLSLIIFYPFKTNTDGGAVAFFTLLGGLLVCVLWVHFLADEISLE